MFIVAAALSCAAETPPTAPEWIPLLQGNKLQGWSVKVDGKPDAKIGSVAALKDGVLTGYPDADGPKPAAALVHERVFSNYLVSLEYEWAAKPAESKAPNAGLLYQSSALDDLSHSVWPRSLQAQIKTGATGDLIFMGTGGYSWVNPDGPSGKAFTALLPERGGLTTFAVSSANANFGKLPPQETENGWNRLDVVVHGSASVSQFVNGTLRLRAMHLKNPDGSPRVEGRIGLQLEGAPIRYRNLRVRPLQPPLAVSESLVVLSNLRDVSQSTRTVVVTNPGPAPVRLEHMLIGTQSPQFAAIPASDAPAVLPAGGRTTFEILFNPTLNIGVPRASAGLQIGPAELGAFIVLQGLPLASESVSDEPSLANLCDALALVRDEPAEETSPSLLAAREGPVVVTPLARFSKAGSLSVSWRAGATGKDIPIALLASLEGASDAHKTLFPPIAGGVSKVEFSPGAEVFNLKVGDRLTRVRTQPVRSCQFRELKDARLLAYDLDGDGDFQDVVLLVENVKTTP